MYYKDGKQYVLKLNDFANENAVSVRTVQKKLNAEKYKPFLAGEFIRTPSDGTWLTQNAVEFLKSTLRTGKVAGVITSERYEREIFELKQQLFDTQEKFTSYVANATPLLQKAAEQIALVERAGEMKEEIKVLEAQNRDLSTEKEKLVLDIQNEREMTQKLSKELTEAEKEIERLTDEKEALENRTFGDYLKGLFRKKGKKHEKESSNQKTQQAK